MNKKTNVYRIYPEKNYFEIKARWVSSDFYIKVPYLDIIADDPESASRGAELLGVLKSDIFFIKPLSFKIQTK